MGAFFITPRSPADAPPADAPAEPRQDPAHKRVCDRFAAEGFAPPAVRETRHWRLYVFAKIGAPAHDAAPCLHDDDAGDFCAVTGTVVYRHTTGRAAAALILADLKAGGLDAREIYGQYAILTGIGGALSLQTDPIGTYPVWHNDDHLAVSSSFMAVADATGSLSIDPQTIYEYVFQGTTYGDRTLFREIHLHPCRRRTTFGPAVDTEEIHPLIRGATDPAPLDVHLERNLANLNRYYDALTAAFGDRIDTALSGGYDSRLTLALLRARGVSPSVHVYGRPDNPDVIVARTVAAGEGFALEEIDKSADATIDPAAFGEVVRRNMLAFQGHPADGIFDNGSDLRTRLDRCAGGRVALNGGGGEIFRNFFYLRDRPFSVRELLWSFYGAFDPAWCTDAFDEGVYLANLGRKVKQVLGTDSDRLARIDVEAVYPHFRCRYWMGKNNSVNNRLGPALTPFIDANVIADALAVPLKYKNSGMFEGRLIRAVSPALAGYMSDYGHSFADDPPLRRRLTDRLVYLRPPRARRLSFRIKHRTRPELPYWLTPQYLREAIDPAAPYMSRFFRIDRVNSLDQLNRIYTLERLFEHAQPRGAGQP